MIKYFIRHYWRYLAMALAFATISFLVNSCEVKAETSIQSESLNYEQTISSGSGKDFNIFSSSNKLINYGRGVLQFNIMTYSFSTNTSHLNNSIAEVTVTSTGSIFTCNIGNAINNYDQETNYDVNLYSVMCDVNLGSNGLQRIDVKMVYNLSNSYTLKTSQYMTFVGDVDLSIYNNLNTINGTLSNYLQSIYNNITTTNNHLASLENIVNTDLTTIMNLMGSTINAINNQTTTIINKINEMIENNQVCYYTDKKDIEIDNQAINNIGNLFNNNSYGVSKYYIITINTKIKVLENMPENGGFLYFYNKNKEKISGLVISSLTNNQNLNIPSNAKYFRYSIFKNWNKPVFEICDTSQNMLNQQNEEIISSINDSSTDDPTNDLNDMAQNEVSNSVISDLLLLPINMFQNILNAVNGTCNNFNLGSLFNNNLTLPCINIQNYLGNSLYNVIDVIISGLFILSLRKKFVDIFENITSLKDRGNELE